MAHPLNLPLDVTAIERGLDLLRQAAEHPEAVPAARQILRNWLHRLDRVSVLDGAGLLRVQRELQQLLDWFGGAHDHRASSADRAADAERQIESIRRRLIAVVGEHGLD